MSTWHREMCFNEMLKIESTPILITPNKMLVKSVSEVRNLFFLSIFGVWFSQ